MTDSEDPGFAPEAGGELRQREIQGFRVDSEKKEWESVQHGGVAGWHPRNKEPSP